MNQRIEELERQVRELSEKVEALNGGEISKDGWGIRFGKLDDLEFKVGEWLYIENNYQYPIIRVSKIENNSLFSIRFAKDFGKSNDDGYQRESIRRKATPTEIETALRKEAKRRGLIPGVKINQLSKWNIGNPNEPDNKKFQILDLPYEYENRNDILHVGNLIVYKQGEWAEPKKKSNTFFEWDVNRIEMPLYEENIIEIGCREFAVSFLMDLGNALGDVSDKTVQEVLDELKKLDL